jgi:uncharacterized RDD family membrane protein YckC
VPIGALYCPICGRATGIGFRYAGFWIRLVALLIDSVILVIAGVALVIVAGAFFPLVVQILAPILFSATYTIGFWVSHGATPGKMAVGIRITLMDGSPLSFGTALWRYLVFNVPLLIFGVFYASIMGIMIGVSRDKRGPQDYAANTVVVFSR